MLEPRCVPKIHKLALVKLVSEQMMKILNISKWGIGSIPKGGGLLKRWKRTMTLLQWFKLARLHTLNTCGMYGYQSSWCMKHPKKCGKWQWKNWLNTMNKKWYIVSKLQKCLVPISKVSSFHVFHKSWSLRAWNMLCGIIKEVFIVKVVFNCIARSSTPYTPTCIEGCLSTNCILCSPWH